MLSNTAVPKYYGQFRDAVMAGKIPVNEKVSMQMNRIDKLIANPGVYYDDKAIDGYVAFCNNELTLTDGEDLTLLDSFMLWAEDLLSWYYFEEVSVYDPNTKKYVTKMKKRRLRNKQYLIVGRGAAKSVYIASLQAYVCIIDTSTTDGVVTAPTMKMALETTGPITTAITRRRGPLFKFLTMGSLQNTTGDRALRQKLCSTKEGIKNFLTNSIIRILPMTIDRLQGLRCKIATIDEWLSGDIREDVVGAIEGGASKIDDYLIVAVSSEGTVRNGPGDDIKMELDKILKGEYEDEHTSIWWYKLDDVKEVGNPATWLKANPNIGYTVSYDAYEKDVKRAEHVPSARNDILAKRFGLPLEGYTYFFTYAETKAVERMLNFDGRICAMGSDLSQGDDFCAFTFLFPLGGDHYGVKTRSYISSLTLMRLPPSLRMKYEEFRKEGSLEVIDCNVLNMTTVYQDLEQFILRHNYQVLAHGYDPYNADEFVKEWAAFHGPFGIECVKQGAKTETVPLGELKTLASERLLEFDEQLMEFTMGNCITLEDTNGNRKLLKRRREEKIDNVAALLDAWVAYKRNYQIFDI